MAERLPEEIHSMSLNDKVSSGSDEITYSGAELNQPVRWKDLQLKNDFALKCGGKTITSVITSVGEPTMWFKLLDEKGTALRNFECFASNLPNGYSDKFTEFENKTVKECHEYFTTQKAKPQRKEFQKYLFVKWLNDNNGDSTNFFQFCLRKDKSAWYETWLAIVCGLVKIPNPPMTNGGGSKPCKKSRCNFCKESPCMVSEQTEIKTPSQTIPLTHELTCEDNGIYVATCTQEGCGAQYVGKTKNPFEERWDDHKRDWGTFLGKLSKKSKVAESSVEKNEYRLKSDDALSKKEECRNQNSKYGLAEHYETSHETIFAEKPDMHTCYSLTFVDKLSGTAELEDLEFIWIYRICPIINKQTVTPSTKLHKKS